MTKFKINQKDLSCIYPKRNVNDAEPSERIQCTACAAEKKTTLSVSQTRKLYTCICLL